ncbi:MAG: sigma-70 family RNA polymerase sigma factor [Deltaproteobacteria bacterium]|nr:sigma-70 family RNA polymerase sigma factor [Deltaproteobacteria bacterium]
MGRKNRSTSGADYREREAELIERVVRGEREAEMELYRAHRRQVAANLYRVLGHADDLEDLIQEVFIIAFRGLGKFRRDSRLSTWLYRIAVNVALGNIRKRSRRPRTVLVAEAGERRVADPALSPYQQVARGQDRELCYRVMEMLAPKKRMVLYLHEIEGKDLKDIAAILGVNPVTIRTRLFYARREFHKLIDSEMQRLDTEVES